MKKLLLLIACASTGLAHGMLKEMIVTKLYKEFKNNFSGLTLDECQKRLTEAKHLKWLYEPRSDTTSMKVVRSVLTTEYFSDLTEREQHKVHKNPSAKLEKIIKRLTVINQSRKTNRSHKQLQPNRRSRRLMLQIKKENPTTN